jgi:hypothetical protein
MSSSNSANENSKMDGSPDSWGKLFNGTSIANPGGILAVFADEAPLDKFIGGWHITALFAKNKDDERFYKSIWHFIPEKNLNRNVLDNIKKAIIHYSNELKIPEKIVTKITNELKIYKFSSLESEYILKALEKIDNDSAVAISCAQDYRFNIEGHSDDYLDTWSGLKFRMRTKDQILDFHIINLLNELHKVSIEKKLFIISFFEGYGFSENKFPPEIENMENLTIITLSKSIERVKEQKILKQIAYIKNEENAFLLIEENIEEPVKKSILKSFVLTKNKKVIEAWRIIAPYINELKNFDQSTILAISQTAFAAGKLDKCIELLKVADEKGIEDKLLWGFYEQKLFNLMRIIHNTHSKSKLSDLAKLKVNFADPAKPTISPLDEAQAYETYFKMGVKSPVDILMDKDKDMRPTILSWNATVKAPPTKIKDHIK